MAINSFEIEREFNLTKDEISRFITSGKSKLPPSELYEKLDWEFEKVKASHLKNRDRINLLHAEHNYLIRKSYQYHQDNPTKSLSLFLLAFEKLLERHQERQYSSSAISNMLLPYQAVIIQISEKREEIRYWEIKLDIERFLNTWKIYRSSIITLAPKSSTIAHKIINLFLEDYYAGVIASLDFKGLDFEPCAIIQSELNDILTSVSKEDNEYAYSRMVISGHIYRLKKKELHSLLKRLFFETDCNKKDEYQARINERAQLLIRYADDAAKNANKFYSSLDEATKNHPNMKKMMAMNELDRLSAIYYVEAYVNMDILKAWNVMDSIKSFIVLKAFNEDVPIPEQALAYFAEEWSLLYIFAKICLLKDEVNKRAKTLGQEWERDAFHQVEEHLNECTGLFKYEITGKKDYSLRIMTSTFSGHFSEYLVGDLCAELSGCGRLNDSPPDFSDFFLCLEGVKRDEIINNYEIEPGGQDIDVYLQGKCAIFLKNAVINTSDLKHMWEEIDLCANHGIRKIFYCVNFTKNIESIDYLRSHYQKVRAKYPDVEISVFDIRDLISNMIDILKKKKKVKRCFINMDLYRIMDY